MLVEPIHTHLKSTGKTLNEAVLEWAVDKFRWRIRRQFMEDRWEGKGRVYTSSISHPCARKSAYQFHGAVKDEELSPRTLINFFCGDIVEVAVLALAKIAGCDIETPYELIKGSGKRMTVTQGGHTFACWPDALGQDGGTWMNVEVKKFNDWAFDRAERERGPTDDWGYLTQSSLEVMAWRQVGVEVKGTLMLAIRGLTGHLAEWFLPYDQTLVDRAFERARQVYASTPEQLPERAFQPIPLEEQKKPRMQLPKLAMQCGYCPYKQDCWEHRLITVMERGRPIFFVSDRVQMPLAQQLEESLKAIGAVPESENEEVPF